MSISTIQWQTVNLRSTNKNLPEESQRIAFFDNGIQNGITFRSGEKLFVDTGLKSKPITSGFLWCYQSTITVLEY